MRRTEQLNTARGHTIAPMWRLCDHGSKACRARGPAHGRTLGKQSISRQTQCGKGNESQHSEWRPWTAVQANVGRVPRKSYSGDGAQCYRCDGGIMESRKWGDGVPEEQMVADNDTKRQCGGSDADWRVNVEGACTHRNQNSKSSILSSFFGSSGRCSTGPWRS